MIAGPAIFPFWDDLWLDTGGDSLGTDIASYRQFPGYTVIEFDSIGFYPPNCTGEVLRFEAVLYDGGRIKLQYHTMEFPPGFCESASIAIQSHGDSHSSALIYYCPGLGFQPVSGLAIWFFVPPDNSPGDGVFTPEGFALHGNYPNPFNAVTQITYALPRADHVYLAVFNIMGEEIAILENSPRAAGTYTVVFDGSSAASGIYFYRLEAGGSVQTQKMVLLK